MRILGPFLKDLIPVLINGMKYSENDIMALKGDEVNMVLLSITVDLQSILG